MIVIKIFDPALCCPTGVCGPSPDTTLLDFMEAIARLQNKYNGRLEVRRFSLNFGFSEYMGHEDVLEVLRDKGPKALPIVKIGDRIVSSGSYPTFELLDRKVEENLG